MVSEKFQAASEILKCCNAKPDNIAFFIQGEAITYQELKELILKIAGIITDNFTKSDYLAVIGSDDPESYAALFACWYCGKAYLPLHSKNPLQRKLAIMEESGVDTVICNKQTIDSKVYQDRGFNMLDTSASHPGLSEKDVRIPEDEDPAYLLFTSGSTGKPKGVPVHFGALNSFLQNFFMEYDVSDRDRFLQIYDISFDGSIPCYIAPLCTGASIYTVPQDEIKYLQAYRLMKQYDLSIVKMTPSVLSFLRPYFRDIHLEKVRYSIFGGEALHKELVNEWSKCIPNAKIQNVYGPSESTVFVLKYEWESGAEPLSEENVVSLGVEFGENRLKILNHQAEEVLEGESGELCIGGPQLFNDYLESSASNGKFTLKKNEKGEVIRYYHTGDRVMKKNDGHYYFLGRMDSQVQVQGFRVELGEIEKHAHDFYKDKALCALAFVNGEGLTEIHLCVESGSTEKNGLVEYLKEHLPGYMQPAQIHYYSVFPLTAGGKLNRQELKNMINNAD